MSNLSQFLGGGGTPVGGLSVIPGAPTNYTEGSVEYLMCGSLKTYSSAYDAALLIAPQIGVYGSDSKQKKTATGATLNWYAYVGTNYFTPTSGGKYSSDLTTWSAITGETPAVIRPASGNGYIVYAPSALNTAMQQSNAGATFTPVGGTFVSCPAKTAICYAPSVGWLALSSLVAAAGEQCYIANVNPTGTWTVGAGSSVGMASVAGIAYGNGVFVAVGSSGGVYGKIATCSTLGGTWTDRTSGASFITTTTLYDGKGIVFTGTHFVATFGNGQVVGRSSDGITWTQVSVPRLSTQYPVYLATDGAGKVVAVPTATGTSTNLPVFYYSADHGATWSVRQMYVGKIAGQHSYCTPSYANGKWIINHSGSFDSPQDLGSMTSPDYVGWQSAFSDPDTTTTYVVRIK